MTFLMAGGGTGGHVIPAIAVAQELCRRGHTAFFIGTRDGFEAKIVPREGFDLEFIRIGGLQRMGITMQLRTLARLPASIAASLESIANRRPAAIFSMGGYVAGPPMLAGWLKRIPMVLMEPNAMPGMVSRWMARFVDRALVSFPEAVKFFPTGKAEVTGRPVRDEFFAIPAKPRSETLTVLITGGSRGSQRLNEAARDSWPLFREAKAPIRFIHQTGPAMHEEIAQGFREAGMQGEVVPFLDDMPRAFAESDMVVCRSGGTVAELAAAGRPSILVPFPYAADDHQRKNAEAMERAGAARMVLNQDISGRRFFEEITNLADQPATLSAMAAAARSLAKPGAAKRAADILESIAR